MWYSIWYSDNFHFCSRSRPVCFILRVCQFVGLISTSNAKRLYSYIKTNVLSKASFSFITLRLVVSLEYISIPIKPVRSYKTGWEKPSDHLLGNIKKIYRHLTTVIWIGIQQKRGRNIDTFNQIPYFLFVRLWFQTGIGYSNHIFSSFVFKLSFFWFLAWKFILPFLKLNDTFWAIHTDNFCSPEFATICETGLY